MSLYGIKTKNENEVNFFERNLAQLRERNLEISKILFSFVAIVVVYNLFQAFYIIILGVKFLFIHEDFSRNTFLLLNHFVVIAFLSVFLLASCFTKSKKILIPNIIFSIIQLIGWLTATIEMTQYQYSSNRLVLQRLDFFDYFPTLSLIPYQVRDYMLSDVSMEIMRIYECSIEVLQIIFLSFLYKFGNKKQ